VSFFADLGPQSHGVFAPDQTCDFRPETHQPEITGQPQDKFHRQQGQSVPGQAKIQRPGINIHSTFTSMLKRQSRLSVRRNRVLNDKRQTTSKAGRPAKGHGRAFLQ
jgi:hypothetical protein